MKAKESEQNELDQLHKDLKKEQEKLEKRQEEKAFW
jgi:hypothetical protein